MTRLSNSDRREHRWGNGALFVDILIASYIFELSQQSYVFLKHSRSLAELSDILDTTYQVDDTDFGEGMKSILDAVHPDLTSPEKDDYIPTLLMPWRGGGLLRGTSSLSSRSVAKRELSGRQ
jgi:hypothetical protein